MDRERGWAEGVDVDVGVDVGVNVGVDWGVGEVRWTRPVVLLQSANGVCEAR